jgi:hypothetical protein
MMLAIKPSFLVVMSLIIYVISLTTRMNEVKNIHEFFSFDQVVENVHMYFRTDSKCS